MMQPRPSQRSQCCRPSHAPSLAGAGMTRPKVIWPILTRPALVLAAAHSRRQKKQQPSGTGLHQAPAAASETAQGQVVGSKLGSSTTSTVYVEGKLLLQTFLDSPSNLLRLSFQLVSATVPGCDGRGTKGEDAVLEAVIGGGEETELDVKLPWHEALGAPGAVVVKNNSDFPVYLKLLSCPAAAGLGIAVDFACHGWVYPIGKHPYRLFFTNDAYVKEDTPSALLGYREDELAVLRGEGVTITTSADERPFQEWDRVYDYALYNDLGNPDLRKDLARPVLGGSQEYPYPRRTKTGRPPTRTDPHTETRVPLDQQIYVPCDERVGTAVIKAPSLPNLGGHFKSIAEIYGLVGLDDVGRLRKAKEIINSGAASPKLPVPQVISVNPLSWRRDEEFSRQMLAGTNPVCIKRVIKFPITSDLDRSIYGDQDSKITKHHIEINMNAMTVQQAVEGGRLFFVDHHDWVMPYLKRINELPGKEEKGEISQRKAYAARTLLFLNDDSTLRPLAIELSSPHPEDERLGSISTVYTPPDTSKDILSANKFTAWDLAKAHAAVNDTSKNNFIIHWLNAHATMEPLVIATNRQLSVLHPVHRLLKPHFRNTLHINAIGRQIIFGSGDRRKNGDIFRGIQEVTHLPSKYAMEMSSKVYRNWNFAELALPADLIKRGVAKGDPKNPEKLELLIKDYPYAVDGLEIWTAIKKWVTNYCAIYYVNDGAVRSDSELQAWWSEVRYVGHGDLQDANWWPAMDYLADLVETCTTIVWLGSAFHAAVGLGQYGYQGFVPNSPTLTSRPMPEAGAEVTESDFLGSITPRNETLALMGMAATSLMRTGEVFLGQRPDSELWTSERRAAEALARFQARLEVVGDDIRTRNADPALKNRAGPVEVPYTMLTPTREPGPVIRGIPNSITN